MFRFANFCEFAFLKPKTNVEIRHLRIFLKLTAPDLNSYKIIIFQEKAQNV